MLSPSSLESVWSDRGTLPPQRAGVSRAFSDSPQPVRCEPGEGERAGEFPYAPVSDQWG